MRTLKIILYSILVLVAVVVLAGLVFINGIRKVHFPNTMEK